jgi:hypothetical protein
VHGQRKWLEMYVSTNIHAIPASVGCHGCGFRLLRNAGLVATPSLVDLLGAACNSSDDLLRFNPFLSQDSCRRLHDALLLWLQLCVLEDRLGRLHKLTEAAEHHTTAKHELIQDLAVRRGWDVREHPWWLVYEVEGQFQVRWMPAGFAMPLGCRESEH